jgi:hypothetical protein
VSFRNLSSVCYSEQNRKSRRLYLFKSQELPPIYFHRGRREKANRSHCTGEHVHPPLPYFYLRMEKVECCVLLRISTTDEFRKSGNPNCNFLTTSESSEAEERVQPRIKAQFSKLPSESLTKRLNDCVIALTTELSNHLHERLKYVNT